MRVWLAIIVSLHHGSEETVRVMKSCKSVLGGSRCDVISDSAQPIISDRIRLVKLYLIHNVRTVTDHPVSLPYLA